MGQYERLILMAEDELTQYSTDARKIEKLRQKIGLSVSAKEQQEVKKVLLAEMPSNPISQLVETQRQAVALPFWELPVGFVARNFFYATFGLACYCNWYGDRHPRAKVGLEAASQTVGVTNSGRY